NKDETTLGTNPEDDTSTPTDTDGDGSPDALDADDDNDGKTDVEEEGTDPATSTTDACEPSNRHDNCDFDKDGINNGTDTDDDNDGLADIDEVKGEDSSNPDSDGDGICDGPKYLPAKDDFKGCMPGPNLGDSTGDSDGDGIPDYLDPASDGPGFGDSDNDGIDDKVECPALPCRNTNTNDLYDYLNTDSDGDTISDEEEADGIFDNVAAGYVLEENLLDTDGDKIPNYRDVDSDNDGTNDADEVNDPRTPENPKDSDDDGIPDSVDPDSDGDTSGGGDSDLDGISDEEECPDYPTCPDEDNDGKPDYLDSILDSDFDGIPDGDEDSNFDKDNDPTTPKADDAELKTRDTDGDNTPDYLDTDSDGDGKLDEEERDAVYDANNRKDTDDDGIPDVVDADDQGPGAGDSDGDTILDDVECGAFPCRDTDGDGIPDYTDTDSDNDGVLDADEVGDDPKNPKDTDGDGIPDVADPVNGGEGEGGGDSDKDGVSDEDECTSWPNCSDADRDGIPDYLDKDSQPDGAAPSPAPTSDLGTVKTGVHGAGSLSWVFVMLLSVLMLARRKATFILALPLIFSTVAAQAAWWDEMDVYAGAGYGQSYLDPAVGGTGYEIDDHTQNAWKLTGGWDWNDHISIEGYYSNLGRVQLSENAELGYRMLGGNAMLNYWARGGERVKGSIALYAKVGLNHMTNDGDGVSYDSKNQGQLFGAIGAELYLPQKFSVRFEVDSYDTDASLFSLNIIKRFGFKSRTPSTPPLPLVDKNAEQEEQFVAMVEELPVTAAGPKIVQLIPIVLDSDLDGLLDDEDQCPYTPKNVSINELGCATYQGKIGDLIANVQFEVNSSLLTEPSKIALNEIVDMLATYPSVKIEVQAHSDNTGSAGYNKKLSQKRAESVVSYLERKNIVANRLEAIGHGEDMPIADNITPVGRAKNRRVEFILQAL
ncbi:MAG: OmpA family protein, partial [Oleispira sp.]